MKNKQTRQKQKIKSNNAILIIIIIILILCFSFSIYKIINWFFDNKKTTENIEKVTKLTEINDIEDSAETVLVPAPENKADPYWDYIKIPLINVDFNELLKTNSDTVGWIYVSGTNINYPVVQTSNNKYYLNVSFDDKYNDAGWIFMDYRNNPIDFDKNTIIYGHSRYDKSMFGSLRNITKNSWYKDTDNYIIKYSSPTFNSLWQVFSVYTIEAESYYIENSFENNSKYQNWLDEMLKRSVFDFNTDVTTDDKVLTLSSCYTSNGIRVVLQAKLIKYEMR